MTKRHSTPIRRTTTSTPNPATADPQTQSDSEAPWQQLMVFNYLLSEVMDAMARERATEYQTPLNQSWQQFLYHLRLAKPELCVRLDHMLQQGVFDEHGGSQ